MDPSHVEGVVVNTGRIINILLIVVLVLLIVWLVTTLL